MIAVLGTEPLGVRHRLLTDVGGVAYATATLETLLSYARAWGVTTLHLDERPNAAGLLRIVFGNGDTYATHVPLFATLMCWWRAHRVLHAVPTTVLSVDPLTGLTRQISTNVTATILSRRALFLSPAAAP